MRAGGQFVYEYLAKASDYPLFGGIGTRCAAAGELGAKQKAIEESERAASLAVPIKTAGRWAVRH